MPEVLKTSLVILISQLPLVGGGWLWWTDRLQTRPAYAALAAGVYEAALVIAAFVRKVWKDELEKDAVRVTADWVRGVVRGFAPGFRRRYKKQVVEDHGIFNVRGLGLINTYTLKLEHVFVDLRVDPSGNPLRSNPDPLARKELTGNRPVWDFLRAGSGVREASALAVIGPPGCGKTTLLQHVAVTLAANRQRRHRVRGHTPILLFLRDHVGKILREQTPSLGRLVQDYFGDMQLFPTLRTPHGWFERTLEGGRCMVLLDGLDEVADADERRAVSAWVDKQIANYPRCRFVLTARPQGYAAAPLQRAHVLEVQPFNASQVRRFVENWYLANEVVASGGREDEGVRGRARKDAEDLLRRLRATPSLDALTVNPLLLTMIAMVHRYHGALPGSRVELYAEICEVLLGRWRQSRGVQDPLKTGQKLVVLRPLAAHMMESKVRDVTAEDAASVIAGPLKLVGVTADEAPKKFLSELESGSGLLLEREAGQWSFAHLTFQEYLTAAHWLEEKETERDWRALVGDSWWHETLRLYVAQGDATPLLRACLEDDTVPALALAADFLEEARRILPEVRRAAEQRLIEDLESEDLARRRLASEVRLTRRLRKLRRIDEQREIDLDFITCAEYRLFLDDLRRTYGPLYYRPDHWAEPAFAKGDALKPVTGVRGEAAGAFCTWLTAKHGGATYRLPRPDEAEAHPPESTLMMTWCRDGKGNSMRGVADWGREVVEQLKGLSSLPPPSFQDLCLSLYRDRAVALARTNNPGDTLVNAHRVALEAGLETTLDRARSEAHFLDSYLGGAKTSGPRGDRNPSPVIYRRVVDFLTEAIHTSGRFVEVLSFSAALSRNHSISLASDCASADFDDPAVLERLLAFTLSFTLARDLDLARNQAHELSKDLNRDGSFGVNYWEDSYDTYLKRVRAIEPYLHDKYVIDCIKGGDLVRALDHLRAPSGDPQCLQARLSGLLHERSDFVYGRMDHEAELVRRRSVVRILEYFYVSCKEMRRLYSTLYGMGIPDLKASEQAALELYWWLQIVIARSDGKLPAWEGIRVVREEASADAAGGRRVT
ncbi:MAG TPA: NACHT domain-containing protein [Pyrinomonadaceae bacterium]|jgi:energy-coupling factor transporter ATP-binding protein EcfA2|nr:NACHT domain-containing protein [Pyrinomonadaceae bacterium]